jgi:hypothetical protein
MQALRSELLQLRFNCVRTEGFYRAVGIGESLKKGDAARDGVLEKEGCAIAHGK